MTDWRLIASDDGKARKFELHDAGKKLATVETVRPMRLDQLKALLSPAVS